MTSVDPESFRVFPDQVCSEKNGIKYLCDKKYDAEDKLHKYLNGEIVSVSE